MKLDCRYTNRKALVYTRQSTPRQVVKNVGSQAHQRDQRRHAINMGFAAVDVEVLDGDLGKSGATTNRRQEYESLRARVRSREVGAIFASDMSRLGRNAGELLNLLQDCRDYDVLIVLDGKPNDPSTPTQHFLHQMLAILAEYDNVRRTEMMATARLAKARIGRAVSAPPTGYVAGKHGTWHLDPDRRVQESIRAVFRVFAEERSLNRTSRRLQQLRVVIWTRDGARIVRRKPLVANIERILHNPAYMGEYRFPQRKRDPRAGLTARGYPRSRRATPEEVVVIPEHHVPYVTRQQWEDNLRILALNAPTRDQRNPGPGSALLQGVIRCGMHRGLAMSTRYAAPRRDGTASHRYQCIGTYLEGGQECGCVPGGHLDRAAATALLARLAVPELTAIKAAWDDARRNALDEDRRRRIEQQRAQLRVDDAKSRFLNTNPNHRHAAEICEVELEEAVRSLKELDRLLANEPSAIEGFTDETWGELLSLCSDRDAVWNAETTEHRDRKQLLRTMVKAVVVEDRIKRGRRTERMTARVVWADGHDETLLEVRLLPYAYELIAQFDGAKCDAGEIARRLNSEGLVTNQGNPWTRDTVAHAVRSLRERRPTQ